MATATTWISADKLEALPKKHREILDILADGRSYSRRELAAKANVSEDSLPTYLSTIRKVLAPLGFDISGERYFNNAWHRWVGIKSAVIHT